ncbi:MAG: glycosyltransferase family 2 protein [Candidatus Hodarchaeales archaeon]|jgi:glycosyltransferase involved in cell wall biosynthesis
MSVGIYMPAFDVEKYIETSIKSIRDQIYKDWELVIIDDCSSDRTYKIAKTEEDDMVSVHRRTNHCGRIGKIKNEAIFKLKDNHEYICHVGSDDMIPNNCLKTFVDFMDKNLDIGACCGSFICFNDEGQKWSLPHVINTDHYDPNILLKYMCLFPMRFYRKSIVDSVGGYSNKLTSAVDYDLALKIDEVTSIHRIKDPITYYYRQHKNQVSTKARIEQNTNAKKALEDALKRRNINGIVLNDQPPFKIKIEEHFIWGSK